MLIDNPVVETPPQFLATAHLSAVLRTDPAERDAAYDALVADLRTAAAACA